MKPIKKRLLLSIGSSVIMVVLLALGFFAGRYRIIRPFEKEINEFSQTAALGDLIRDDQKDIFSNAYYEKDNALRNMKQFSWVPPNMPAPFVGSVPVPGRHGNAYINSMQFRAEDEIKMPKPPDTYRIFITGGSTAYGSGAPSQERTISGSLLSG